MVLFQRNVENYNFPMFQGVQHFRRGGVQLLINISHTTNSNFPLKIGQRKSNDHIGENGKSLFLLSKLDYFSW